MAKDDPTFLSSSSVSFSVFAIFFFFFLLLSAALMSSFVLVRRREQIPVWKSNIVSFVKALYERHLKAHVDNAYKKTSHFVDRVKEKVLHAKTKSD